MDLVRAASLPSYRWETVRANGTLQRITSTAIACLRTYLGRVVKRCPTRTRPLARINLATATFTDGVLVADGAILVKSWLVKNEVRMYASFSSCKGVFALVGMVPASCTALRIASPQGAQSPAIYSGAIPHFQRTYPAIYIAS